MMQFPPEFEWLSPDGTGLLTSYMPNHYSAGWITQHAADLATAEEDAYTQFRQLAPVAATQNVMLPVGGDHVVPVPLGDGDPPGLEFALRVAEVRDRRAERVLRAVRAAGRCRPVPGSCRRPGT